MVQRGIHLTIHLSTQTSQLAVKVSFVFELNAELKSLIEERSSSVLMLFESVRAAVIASNR